MGFQVLGNLEAESEIERSQVVEWIGEVSVNVLDTWRLFRRRR